MTEQEYFARTKEDVLADAGKSPSLTSAGVDSRGRPIGHTGLRYGGDAYHDKQSASFQNYLSNKATYGSSSAWYNSAVKKQGQKQQQISTLEERIKNASKINSQTKFGTGHGMRELNIASANFALDTGGKTVEELQKELEQAQRELAVLDEDLANAAQWRHYDVDMEWLENVNKSGQEMGFVSDNLYQMYGAIDSKYNELLDSIQEAEKNNSYLDNLRRQGGIPAEVGFEYTGAEEIARMYDELYELGELRDMANRRYSYSVDELIKKGDDVKLGKVKADAYNKDAEAANEQARAEYAKNHVKGDTMGGVWDVLRTDQSNYSPGESWTEEQLNRYYVIFQRQGAEAAKKFAAEVNTYNNLDQRNQDMEKFRAFGAERTMDNAEGFWGKLGAGLADTGRGLAGTAGEVLGMPGDLLRYLDKTQDVIATGTYTGDKGPSIFKYGLSDYGRAISEGRAETLNQLGTVSGKGLGDLYRLTGSMAQSLVYGNIAGSAGTLTLFFGSAANQGFDEAMSRGASGEQAMVYGMLSGIGEAAAEIIPLENLLNADKSLTRGFLKAALYQAGFEGLEEGETDILNTIADQLVLKDKSEINSAIRMRMAQGESYEQAAKAEWSKLVKDVVWDMVGGAISGAGSSAIQYGVHLARPYQANAQGEYRYGADAKTLAAEASSMPEGDKDLAKVRSLGQKTAARVEQGKTVSNRTVEKLAKGTNRAAMVDAVEQQLNERAESVKKEDRRMMANAIVSVARNESPGPKGKRLIEANKEISDAIIKELDIKQPAKWAQQIGVRGVEGIAYGDKTEMQAYKKVKADASEIKASHAEAMYAEVSIPTGKEKVSGKLTGLSMKNKPAFIIQSEDGKLHEVPIDVAINSGALPDGVARLAWEVQGLDELAGEAYKLYEPGQDVTDYITDLREAIALAGDVSTREVFNKSETVQRLTKQQQAFAWNEGLQRHNKATAGRGGTLTRGKKKDPVKRDLVSFEGAKVYGVEYKATSKDKIKANELRAIEAIAKVSNVNVVFYETDSDSKGDYIGANGFYHNGTIYLDIHAGAKNNAEQDAILLTAAHELTHHIRENAPKQYEALKAFVTDHLIEHGHNFEQMVQSRLAEPNMSRDEAVEEVVADACEMVLKDSKAVEKLAKENKSLAQTIADWLHGFYEDIKAAFEGVEAQSREAKAMTDYMDELVKLWDDALIEASKVESKQSGKVKQSIRTDFYTEFDNWNGKSKKIFQVGETSEVLKNIGVKDKGVIWHSGKITEIMRKHPNMTKDIIKQVPQILENPVIILKSKGSESRLVIFGTVNDTKGKPITAILELESKDKQGHVLNLNVIASAYAKDNAKNLVESSDLVYLDPNKKRTKNWMQSVGLQLPSDAIAFGSVGKITYHGDKVKIDAIPYVQYMHNVTGIITDSEGNTLSQEQQEYFKDSKVRDADGKLLVMYHQTANDFTVFDPRRNGAGSSDTETPYGIFLKSSPDDIGLKGKKQMMLYANITNPLFASNREELREKLFELSGEYRKLYEEAERIDEEYHQKYLQLDEETMAAIRKWRQGNPEGTRREAFETPEVKRLREKTRKLLDEEWPAANRDIEAKAKEAINLALESNEYDGVILQNDVGSFGRTTDAYIALRPEQVKNVDNSAPTTNLDIRYSRRDSFEGLTKEEARAQARSYTRLAAENAELRRRVEYWQEQSKESRQRTVNQKDVEKYAKQLVRQHDSTVSAKWIRDQLVAMGNYILQNKDLNYNWLRTLSWKIATDIVVNAEAVYDEGYDVDTKEAIVGSIKAARMHLDPQYKNDLPEGFRKQYSGKLHISFEEGRGVDSVYAELQEAYGYTLFPNMPTQADMLIMMGEAYDTVTAAPKTYNPYRSSMNETITSISNDILDMMTSENIREAVTRRDKAEEKIKAAKQEGRDRVKELRDSKNARIEDIKRQESARRKEARAKEKAAKWEKVAAVKTHYRDQIKREREARNESAAAQRYRASIFKNITRLSNMLIKNSDKEHVPEALKEPVLDFITSIDVSSRRLLKKGEATLTDEKYTEKMQRLKTVLGRQRAYMQKPGEVDGLDVFLDLPDGFEEMIEEHIESMARLLKEHKLIDEMGPISYMNSRQLYELDHILTVLSNSISQINSFITESRFESVKESARESRQYMRSLGTEVQRSLAKDVADRFLSWGNALPIYVFKRFGEAGSERFTALSKGWGQMAMNAQFILNFTKDAYTTEEVREWEETVHRIAFSDGRKAEMTTAQIMGLYCSFKREQARQHLLTGGMRVGNIETGKGAKKSIISQVDAFHLTHDDIINITGELSVRQMEVADRLQEFMNTTCADWGNEISMARFGYRQFVEENYYPISTDPNNFPAVDPQARENDIFRLLNMAFTKQLNPKANNSIVINSIFDVFSAHAADMAKYNALALPILDMMKWYNYKDSLHTDVEDSMGNVNRQLRAESVQSMTERAYGKQAQNYMINFLKDLNGKREGGRNEDMLKGLLGKYKAAAVGANVRVAIQQPTSIVRASYVLNPVYLARGAAMKGGIEEALEHSGIAVWKSLGYFDTNIARGMRQQIKHADTGMDKLRDKSMWLAEQGDKITWGAIWNACKLEQEDMGLEGAALIKATAERFDEVILSTQVLDSTISRSDMMRNQTLAVSEITSFMSEPTVSYNMLLDSVNHFVTAYRQTKDLSAARREAWPHMGRALLVFGTGTFATAAAAAIVDALRDDDDYQNYAEKWLEAMKKNTLQGINPVMLLPFISDLWEIAVKDEAPESMLYQSFTQAKKGVTAALDMAKLMFNPEAEVSEANRTSWGRLYYVAQAIGSLSGIPVAGFMREFKTVWNMSGALITGKKLKNYDSGVKNNVKYGVLDGYIDEEKAIALLTASGEYDNPDDVYWQVQEWLYADDSEWSRYNDVYAAIKAKDKKAFTAAQDALGDHGIAPKSVRAEAKRYIGKQFIGEEGIPASMDEKTALAALQDFAGLTKIEAQHLIDEWKFEKETGVRWADLKDEYVAGTFDKQKVQGYLINYGHEYSKDAAEKVQEWTCEKNTGFAFSELCDAFIHGELTAEQTQKYLEKYGGETTADAAAKVAQWSLAPEYGVKYSSTDAGIKKNLIEGHISDETAKAIMVTYGGKSWEEAEDYVNQYHFTEETGYSWSEIGEAYADGVIDYEKMVEWFTVASLDTHGSEEVAREYAEVEQWKKDIEGAEKINRTALDKWNTKGDYMTRAGLNKVDFAHAWNLYSTSYSQYDAYGNKTKEKAQVFFEKLYGLYQQGIYSEKEIDAIARTVYSKSYVNKYAMW